MKLKNKTIFILSPEAWGTSFVSKHHYATLLASEGNQVFFINPPSSNFKKNKLNDHLTIIDYSVGSFRGINRLPSFLRDIFNRILIGKLQRFIGKKPDIIWSFDPFRFQNLQLFGAYCKIYHPVDVHQTNLEVEAAKTADVIFSTANKILERFSSIKTPKYFINHGLATHFLENSTEIDFEVSKNSINVGYVGNLNYQYLDKEILAEILNENVDDTNMRNCARNLRGADINRGDRCVALFCHLVAPSTLCAHRAHHTPAHPNATPYLHHHGLTVGAAGLGDGSEGAGLGLGPTDGGGGRTPFAV